MSDIPNIEKQDSIKDLLISELDRFDVNVLKLALMQARYYTLFGVDVTEKWDTATEQSHMLDSAYAKGFHDGAAQHLKGD